MNRIRVAIGEVHSGMSRDILEQITHLEPDIEFVGEVAHDNLKDDLARHRADVLICDVGADELPAVCQTLFTEQNAPIVVGLAREGREAAVCVPNAGSAQLMSVIRAAVLGAGDESKVVELVRPQEPAREAAAPAPYSSIWECLEDQLRALDLALLAEVHTFESTTWDEGVQRLQGLAISPEEVRALLQKSGTGPAPARIGELRRRHLRLAEAMAQRMTASAGRPDAPPFVRLAERFELNPFEQFCITATLALEIDRNKYGKAYSLLQDDVTRKQPSVELLLRLYDGFNQRERWEGTRAFDSSAPLRRWNLLRLAAREAGDPATAFGRRVELDDRIARYLLALGDLGPQLEDVAAVGGWDAAALQTPPDQRIEDRLAALVADPPGSGGGPSRLVVHVHGRSGAGRRSLIAAVCRRRALRLIRIDAGRLLALPAAAFDETLLMLAREPLLENAALCLENVDPLLSGEASPAQALMTAIETLRGTASVLFLLGQRRWLPESLARGGALHSVGLELPDAAEARRRWAAALAQDELDPTAGGVEHVARELGGRFALSPGQIQDAVAAARLRAQWRDAAHGVTLADLYQGCRDQCGHRLATLARQVTTGFGWDDLIVPVTQRNQLRELEMAIRNLRGVLDDWNFESRLPYGRGITALFSGPSGTGKTMAAGILARELGLDLYQIDLSRVVSKYIGETERNLDRIFEEAENANAMLFFDEADALFGKRSAIKDAHDRYANIEVAYLLQKMEEREGVTILATNLRANIDEAFLRRIRFVVEFPLPEHAQRLEIWRGSLPKEVRLAADVDLAALASRFRLSGGSIVNISLAAASLAYAPGGVIGMKHLLHATKRELQKLGMQYHESDFAPELTVVSGGRTRVGA
jgi:Winged helix domain, variant/ATPase family associated with various cellular activities (AAA)